MCNARYTLLYLALFCRDSTAEQPAHEFFGVLRASYNFIQYSVSQIARPECSTSCCRTGCQSKHNSAAFHLKHWPCFFTHSSFILRRHHHHWVIYNVIFLIWFSWEMKNRTSYLKMLSTVQKYIAPMGTTTAKKHTYYPEKCIKQDCVYEISLHMPQLSLLPKLHQRKTEVHL